MKAGTELNNAAAVSVANKRMQIEVLPYLGRIHPEPHLWNPLRDDPTSKYGMALVLTDALALEIMKSDALMSLTEEIVMESQIDGLVQDPKASEAFVRDIIATLMSKK